MTIAVHQVGADTLLFRWATDVDVKYVVGLQNNNRESVGHLPTPALRQRIECGTIRLGELNGEPFGYLMFDVRRDVVNIIQACIQYDARRSLYGSRLYQDVLSLMNPTVVHLRCAADLEANLFWRGMGLICVGGVLGGKRRGRRINLWRHFVSPTLFAAVELSTTPSFQQREDCIYDDSGFLMSLPSGFSDHGTLGKIAWRKTRGK